MYLFQSTLPARGATCQSSARVKRINDFNPRSPHGERRGEIFGAFCVKQFQSTLPARGATSPLSFPATNTKVHFNPRSPHGERHSSDGVFLQHSPFQSTLPARGATVSDIVLSDVLRISIHAPRTGSDVKRSMIIALEADFNPRSPHGERQPCASSPATVSVFQSTLPARGATDLEDFLGHRAVISIHAPRTGSDQSRQPPPERPAISIHAPRTGSDQSQSRQPPAASNFNPRSPHGERLLLFRALWRAHIDFNPRSPHGERPTLPTAPTSLPNFNPRSPHGERRRNAAESRGRHAFQSTLPARGATAAIRQQEKDAQFQSTLPARGATRRCADYRVVRRISIHAPRTGSDNKSPGQKEVRIIFQSTLPARGATKLTAYQRPWWEISIHAPRTGSDLIV